MGESKINDETHFKSNTGLKLTFCFLTLAILVLGAAYAVISFVDDPMIAMAILASVTAVLFLVAIIFSTTFVKRAEKEHLHEGVRLVIESVPVVSSLVDKDSNLVYCNDEAPKLFDFSSKKEYMDNWFNIMPEFQPDGSPSHKKLDELMKGAFVSGRAAFELMQKKLNNEPVPCDFTLVRVNIQGEQYLLEFTRDLRQSYAVREMEEGMLRRMETIVDASPLVFALFDENSLPIQVNKRAEEIFNIPDKQIFLDDVERFWPEFQPNGKSSMEWAVEVAQLALQKGQYRHEFMYQTYDGQQIPMEEVLQKIVIDGKDLLVTYLRDLREHYKNKDADAEAQKKLNIILDRLNEHLGTQVSAITESSAAMEQMIANIRSVTSTVARNAENVKALEESSAVGHSGLTGVVADIKQISQESQSLMEINSVMQNIASQTNLLSMNAAIEAAHAGESGRGFAVVADEIRKLAESSSAQSKTISGVLKNIKSSIDKITKSTNSVLDKFNDIDSRVKTVAEHEGGILDAMTEQGSGSEQIMQAIVQVNEITSLVKNDAGQMLAAAAKLEG